MSGFIRVSRQAALSARAAMRATSAASPSARLLSAPASRAMSTSLGRAAVANRTAIRRAGCAVTDVCRRQLHVPAIAQEPAQASATLTKTLQKEISHEEETYAGTPEDIDEFINSWGWEMEDTEGNREVYLRRKVGNEEINITFGVMDPQQQMESLEGEEEVAMEEPPVVIPFTVCVTKGSGSNDFGTMTAEMVACQGRCDITQLTYSSSTDEAMGDSADHFEDRLANYPGPNLHDLDPDVKDALVDFFSARGVNDELAAFIERVYYDKEQREYVNWLRSLHAFLQK